MASLSTVDVLVVQDMALKRLGVRGAGPGNPELVTAALFFDMAAGDLMTTFRWSFLTRRAEMVSSGPGLGDWLAAFVDWPLDYIIAQYVWSGTRHETAEQRIPFAIEGSTLCCDYDPVTLVYTGTAIVVGGETTNVVAPQYWIDTLVWRLCMELVMPIVGKPEYAKMVNDAYGASLRKSIATDLNERQNDPDPYPEAIRART